MTKAFQIASIALVALSGFSSSGGPGFASTDPSGTEAFFRGDGGCSMRGNHSFETVYRWCMLDGVTLSLEQERVVAPALSKLAEEIQTSYFDNPRATYARFYKAVSPSFSTKQAARVRANIEETMRRRTK